MAQANETKSSFRLGMRERTMPIGRLLRLTIGVLLILLALRFTFGSSAEILLGAFSVLLAVAVFYAAVHYLVSRVLRNLNRWLGAAIANIPVILVFVFGISGGPLFGSGEGQLAAIVYVGISLLIAGIRADPGCEVMSIPGLIFGHQTHLACIAFSPIDWLEAKLSGEG